MAGGPQHRKRYLDIWKAWRTYSLLPITAAAAALVLGIFGAQADPGLRVLAIFVGILLGQMGAGIWVGPYIGMIANPDMDMENGRRGHTYIKEWPDSLKPMWAEFWREYSRQIPHRSAQSHAPGLSTSIRLSYLLRPVKARTGPLWPFLHIVGAPFCLFVWLGMYRQDLSHALLDRWFAQNRK